jgi:hypothetical protein
VNIQLQIVAILIRGLQVRIRIAFKNPHSQNTSLTDVVNAINKLSDSITEYMTSTQEQLELIDSRLSRLEALLPNPVGLQNSETRATTP